jgi:1-deoxy-D-xylulose-5-phosphate reductoisomerase
MNLAVLGATGSIGASTLDVAARHPDRYRVFALSAHRSADALLELCRAHRPRYAVLSGTTESRELRERFLEQKTELLFGAGSLDRVAADPDCNAVMAAIVGAAGLASTLAAARAGKRVLLANKEALVMTGPLMMAAARDGGAQVVPVDSEHNAVFQCFSDNKDIRKIVLTASGGPFRTLALDKLEGVTPEQACAHPNWVMGRKISVDSATMMNKALEVIEARYLFGVTPEQVEVVIHPQSVVHSMVQFTDASVIAQLGTPDMRVPIACGLAWPERIESGATRLDFRSLAALTFETPDDALFPGLALAWHALRAAPGTTAVLNAANEVAVEAFLGRRLRFDRIHAVNLETLERVAPSKPASLSDLLALDAMARSAAQAAARRLAA